MTTRNRPTRAQVEAAIRDAVIASDPYRKALIEGRDLWRKIEPITKDNGQNRT